MKGQPHPEGRSLARFAVHLDRAFVRRDQRGDDGQA